MKQPILLAIDTSCDDTAAAVTQGTVVLSNVIASQTELHKPYGGVFPTVAKQAHRENIALCIQKALQKAGVLPSQIEAVAVTQGPGLAPSLEVGIHYGQEFATTHQIPVYALNHLEGHLFSVLAEPNRRITVPNREIKVQFPAIGLIVSGGNTLFVKVEDLQSFTVLGSTLDDAAGECLDKIGRMLNLGYPAGPVIEQFARLGNPQRFPFPLPLTTVKSFDLSFSGLKTFARNKLETLEKNGSLDTQTIYDLCAAAQSGVFRHITYKLEKLLPNQNISELWLGGGVAANSTLRRELRKLLRRVYPNKKVPLRVPYTKRLCMDNAAMIGVAAYANSKNRVHRTQIDRVPRQTL